MGELTFILSETLDEQDREAVREGLRAYNEANYGRGDGRELCVVVRDDSGRIVAGLLGRTSWGWLYVSNLWVAEELRGRGVGSELLARAEVEGLARGCRRAWLDTWQARAFYEKLGWRVFGKLDDFPTGHQRCFLTKNLI